MSDSWFRINLFYFSYFLTKLLSIPHFLFLFYFFLLLFFGRGVRSKSSCFIPVHATTINNLCCASQVLFYGNGNLLPHPALLCKPRMVLLMSSQGQEKLWAKWFHDLVHSICIATHHKWSIESRISHHFICSVTGKLKIWVLSLFSQCSCFFTWQKKISSDCTNMVKLWDLNDLQILQLLD